MHFESAPSILPLDSQHEEYKIKYASQDRLVQSRYFLAATLPYDGDYTQYDQPSKSQTSNQKWICIQNRSSFCKWLTWPTHVTSLSLHSPQTNRHFRKVAPEVAIVTWVVLGTISVASGELSGFFRNNLIPNGHDNKVWNFQLPINQHLVDFS